MFAESTQPHVMKGDLLDLDFSMDMDHRKRRRNRTTQSCLNCHTSKRKCDRKRPCQRCIQLGLTGLCVYEVDDPALRDDPDVDENTRLRNRIAELESLVRELRGKPHPRWADPNYYEGDASDKWHTRSQKRNPASNTKQRRMHSPGPNGNGAEHSGISVKTEPLNDMQHTSYYRLSPSPPPPSSAVSSNAPYGMNNGHPGQYPPGFNGATAGGCSPESYSPSSPAGYSGSSTSSGFSGAYAHPSSDARKLYARQQYSGSDHTAREPHRYEQQCACLSNPAAGHSFINLARQLQGMINYLQHLPEHSQGQRCGTLRRIQELNSALHGEEHPKSSSPPFGAFDSHSESLRSPVESDLMTPLSITSSVPMSAPATPHTLQTMHWGESAHQNGGYNPYFANVPPGADVYAKAVPSYDVVT